MSDDDPTPTEDDAVYDLIGTAMAVAQEAGWSRDDFVNAVWEMVAERHWHEEEQP